jgi:hypothetical protein
MNKENKTEEVDNMTLSFSESHLICQDCGSKRREVELNRIPYEDREFFKIALTFDEFKEKAKLVYCKKCDAYSIISGIPTILF